MCKRLYHWIDQCVTDKVVLIETIHCDILKEIRFVTSSFILCYVTPVITISVWVLQISAIVPWSGLGSKEITIDVVGRRITIVGL